MKKFHIDRLEKLHAFLGTVKPKKFFFGSWATDQNDRYREPDLNVCGTTACALGWAASMPEFRKRGLKMHWDENWEEAYPMLKDKDGDVLTGEDAGAEFFGLSYDEAEELFIPDEEAGRNRDMPLPEYRKRLRKFITRKKRELKIPA